jgi:hypothetical protein
MMAHRGVGKMSSSGGASIQMPASGGASMPGGGHLAPGNREGGSDSLRCEGEAWERQVEERVLE